MSETTKIQWAEHTGGPFLGCSCVSAGCTNCYAMALALSRLEPIFRKAYKAAGFEDWETRPVWGDKATRVLSKGFWDDARRINAKHAKAGTRGRWFPSMIDWLDTMPAGIIDQDGKKLDPIAVLADFLKLIYECQNLDFLLLTKRPENWRNRMEQVQTWAVEKVKGHPPYGAAHNLAMMWCRGEIPKNIWFGVSAENQEQWDKRVGQLVKIPAAVRFVSAEPLLGPIIPNFWSEGGEYDFLPYPAFKGEKTPTGQLHWVIFGGESGKGARPCNVEWIRDGVKQCQAAGVKAFVKQLGSKPICNDTFHGTGNPKDCSNLIKDPKGGDMSEWPDDLKVREMPVCN